MNFNYLKTGFFTVLFLCVLFVSCSSDDDNDSTSQNIVATLASDSDYSSLVAAVQLADLSETLSGGEYTLFAPDNSSFDALLDSNDMWNELSDIPVATLRKVLLNHVISGTAKAADISTGYVNTLATFGDTEDEFLSMYLNSSSGVIINGGSSNGGAMVSRADVAVSNGVIHEVDAVIGLPTVVTFAVADSDTFSTLVSALTTETPATDFVSTLSGTGPFTVFAPTNMGFQALLDSNDSWNSLSDIGESTLTTVLQYHVANGNVRAGDLTNDFSVPTLANESFTIVIPGTNNSVADINDATGTDKNIVVTDVQANNGVIHVPSGVLLPTL